MRIYVPRAVYTMQLNYIKRKWRHRPYYGPSPPMDTVNVYNAVCTPGNTEAIEVTPYFYETRGRRINDCVHAKVLSEGKDKMPLLDVSGGKYTSRITGYTGYQWDQNPYLPPGGQTTSGTPGVRIINDGAFSIRIAQHFEISSTQNYDTYYDVAVYGRVWDRSRYVNRYFDRQLHLRFDGHVGSKTATGHYPVWATFNGSWWWNASLPSGYSTSEEWIRTLATAGEGTSCSAYWGSRYYYYPDPSPHFETMLDLLEQEARRWIRWGLDHNFQGWATAWTQSPTGVSVRLPNPQDFFLLQEDKIVAEGYDPLVLSNHGLPSYWRNVLIQQAYLDAIDHMPRLNDNSISNIIEIAGFIKDLVIDHKVSIPESLSDLWLSYRYSYTTTKLDAEEAISFVGRYRQLGSLSKWIKCYGESHHDYVVDGKTTPITCRCCFEIRPRDVEVLNRIWRALYTYGLQPNFYVIWDMIPYSFIVDWLIPIGSVAHALDAQSNVTEVSYRLRDICFSLSYENKDVYGNIYHLYSRWSQEIPQLNGFYFLEEDAASSKVIGMRILDSLSLIIGRR